MVRLVISIILVIPMLVNAQEPAFLATASNNIKYDNESLLVKALDEIADNRIDAALNSLKQLVNINPDFQLAQLMYADLLMAQVRPVYDFGNVSYAPYEKIAAFRNEARSRWKHHKSFKHEENKVPKDLVQLESGQKFAIVVDLSEPRLYLFENRDGVPNLLKDFYVSIGKNGSGKYVEGDQKTPVGVYFVTESINPEELPDFYGEGAFPIDYPNAWDKRNGYTGYGIWLHGTPIETYSRPPRDSDGCVILSNQYFLALKPYIDAGKTPVILSENINWVSVETWKRQQKKMNAFIEQWRRDWESRDVDLYLSHYSKDFKGLGKEYNGWVEHKRRVSNAKEFIRIKIKDKSMFLYPGQDGLLVVTFEQDYLSDSYKRNYIKRQYWRFEDDGKWRIIYEGSMS